MNITIRENNGVTVIDISGRLTLGEAPASVEGRSSPVDRRRKDANYPEPRRADQSRQLRHGAARSAYATVTHAGGQLKLSNLTSRVKDLLIITKLCTVFEMYEDEPSAIASFAPVAR